MTATNEHLECPCCGGAMEVDADQLMLVCPYCGNHEPLDETTARRLDAETHRETVRAQLAAEQQINERKDKSRRTVRRVLLGIVIAFVALIVLSLAATAIEDALWDAEQDARLNSTYTWPSSGLAQKIPQPDQTKGYIDDLGADWFEIDVACSGEDDWRAYIEKARAAGYTVDEQTSGHDFTAYNEEGYQIDVYLYTYDDPDFMEIRVTPPLQAYALTWPTTGLASLVPQPASLQGQIQSGTETYFDAVITDTSLEAYTAYVDACISAGFDQDYSRRDRSFSGYDSAGRQLSVDYLGFNHMEITLFAGK